MAQTLRLTVAQAIVKWLMAQHIDIDGVETRICGGGFGIFGHGNVPCLGEALYPVRNELPLYRDQNAQSMGFAAAYAKYHLHITCASGSCFAPPVRGRARRTC